MQIREGAYYRTRVGLIVGPLTRVSWCDRIFEASDITWKENGSYVQGITNPLDLISEVYVSDTPPSDDVMLNLSEIARAKTKAMGEGNFGMDENPPCGIRLRWLVEVVDRPHDTPIFLASNPFIQPAPDGPNGPFRIAPEAKTLRDEFAMEAMKLLIPRHERREETLAEFAYRQADEMMEARKK